MNGLSLWTTTFNIAIFFILFRDIFLYYPTTINRRIQEKYEFFLFFPSFFCIITFVVVVSSSFLYIIIIFIIISPTTIFNQRYYSKWIIWAEMYHKSSVCIGQILTGHCIMCVTNSFHIKKITRSIEDNVVLQAITGSRAIVLIR